MKEFEVLSEHGIQTFNNLEDAVSCVLLLADYYPELKNIVTRSFVYRSLIMYQHFEVTPLAINVY